MFRLLLIFVLSLALSGYANTLPVPTAIGLSGETVNPLAPATGTKAVVLFFTAPDCPISNRYAPTMASLAAEFASEEIVCWLVYSDDLADVETIKQHRKDFRLDLPVAIDRQFAIADFVQADVTPEAAVYVFSDASSAPQIVYLGRIDDQYQGFGQYRPAATRHELRDLLAEISDGGLPAFTKTKAIGCYIPRPTANEAPGRKE